MNFYDLLKPSQNKEKHSSHSQAHKFSFAFSILKGVA